MGKALLLIKPAIGWNKADTSPIQNQLQEKKLDLKSLTLFSLPQIFCKVLEAAMFLKWISQYTGLCVLK